MKVLFVGQKVVIKHDVFNHQYYVAGFNAEYVYLCKCETNDIRRAAKRHILESKDQGPLLLLYRGLPGSGKSTLVSKAIPDGGFG
jgi:hypothetical protein